MPEGVREKFSPYFQSLGNQIAKVAPWPNLFTFLGLAFALVSAYFLYMGEFIPGGLMIILSGFMDAIDGSVARAINKVSRKGAFLDSNLDRLAEFAIYLGIGLYRPFLMILSFLALGFSLMVSYSRARMEGLKVSDRPKGIEIGERAERLGVLIIFTLLGYIEIGLYIIIAIAAITFIERLYLYYRSL